VLTVNRTGTEMYTPQQPAAENNTNHNKYTESLN